MGRASERILEETIRGFSCDQIELNKALEFHQFTKTIRLGSQQTWEGFSSGERRVVVVDEADSPYNYGNRVLEGVIRNSGIDKRLFYRAAGKPLPYAAFLRRQS